MGSKLSRDCGGNMMLFNTRRLFLLFYGDGVWWPAAA